LRVLEDRGLAERIHQADTRVVAWRFVGFETDAMFNAAVGAFDAEIA